MHEYHTTILSIVHACVTNVSMSHYYNLDNTRFCYKCFNVTLPYSL